jgi:hypothetical protein
VVINSKRKGSAFETDLTNYLNEHVENGVFKRIANSGALGTKLNEPLLTGDVVGKVHGLDRKIKIESKVGYGGDSQLTMRREWFNKVREEANMDYSLPALICKFSGARGKDGVQLFVALEVKEFIYLLNQISQLTVELDLVYKKMEKENDGKLVVPNS